MLKIKNKFIRKILLRFQLIDPRWDDIKRVDKDWRKRVEYMSSFIPSDTKSILDLGCSEMWLKQCIDNDIAYTGVDIDPLDKSVVRIDFNRYEFSDTYVDTIFISGVLEYIYDLNWFCQQCNHYGKYIILSYCPLEIVSNIKTRRSNAWVNNLSSHELIDLLEQYNFKLLDESQFGEQKIYVLKRKT